MEAEASGKSLPKIVVLAVLLAAVGVLVWILLPTGGHPPAVRYESLAQAALKQYCAAQHMYKESDYGPCNKLEAKQFCPGFRLLGGQQAHKDSQGQPLELIPPEMAAASQQTPHHGYYFMDDPAVKDRRAEFGLYAIPGKYGGPVKRTFWVGTAGLIMAKDLGGKIPGDDTVRDKTWEKP